MSYSGANQASEAREALGKALAALQEDPNIPEDVMSVAQNLAQAVGALFEAEKASSEPDGKACVRNALGTLSQTLALLQDVRTEHKGIEVATEVLAKAMSTLYPLTTKPSAPPPATQTPGAGNVANAPKASAGPGSPPPQGAQGGAAPPPTAPVPPTRQAPQPQAKRPPNPAPSGQPAGVPAPSAGSGGQQSIEVNIGATTESNFFVGFSGEIAEGGVFVATYEVLPVSTPVNMLVTLPGGFDFRAQGKVKFVRDPLDLAAEAEPGMGICFDNLGQNERELVLRFIRKRPPMFYDE